MADLSRTVELIFSGTDDTSRAIRDINSSLSDFGDATQGVAAPLSDMANRVLQVQGALVLFGGVLGGIAFNEAVKLESAMADLNKVLGEGDGQVEQYVAAMKDLALIYGVSSNELIRAMANFKQAGFEAQESADLVKNALDLVIAGDIEAAQASELLVAALKGFNAPASEAGRLIDILNEVSNNYATSVEQLAIGMAAISPIAKTMGFSMEETAAILTPVIEVFRSGDEAAVALKTGLLKLIDDSKPVTDALKAIGVAQTDANGQLRSGHDILFDVAGAFQNLDENQKLFFTAQLVGLDQSARMVKVFDEMAKINEITATALKATGSAMKEVEIRLATAENVINRTKVAFEELAKTVGAEYKAELVGVIDATGAFAKALDDAVASGRFDKLFELIAPQLKAIEEVIRAVAANLDQALAGVDFTNLVDSLGNVGDSLKEVFGAFFGDIDLNTVEGLQSALQKTADAFAALNNVTAGIIESFVPFFEAIREGVDNFSELGETSQRELGRVLGLMKQIIDFGSGVGLAFVAIGKAGIEMGRVMDGVFAAIRLGVNVMESGFQTIGFIILDAFSIIADINSKLTFGDLSAEFAKFSKSAADASAVLKDQLAKNSDEARAALSDLTGAFDAGNPKYQEARDRLDKLAESLKGTADTTKDTGDAFTTAVTPANHYITELEQLGNIGREAALQNRDISASLGIVADSTQLAAIENQRFLQGYINGKPVYSDTARVLDTLGDSTSTLAQKADEAAKKSNDFLLSWLEIQANEREAIFRIAADVDIAKVEAAAQSFEAAFGAISTGLESSADIITGAFDTISNTIYSVNFNKVFDFLEKSVDREFDIREQVIDQQTKLNDALADYFLQRAEAARRGDSEIKISTEGLSPALELVMFEIAERMRVAVTADEGDFLLAVGGA